MIPLTPALTLPFEWHGILITDPNVDETGRFSVDWRTYWTNQTPQETPE